MEEINGVEKCTGMSKVSTKWILIFEGIIVNVYEQKQKVKQLDLATIDNKDNGFF